MQGGLTNGDAELQGEDRDSASDPGDQDVVARLDVRLCERCAVGRQAPERDRRRLGHREMLRAFDHVVLSDDDVLGKGAPPISLLDGSEDPKLFSGHVGSARVFEPVDGGRDQNPLVREMVAGRDDDTDCVCAEDGRCRIGVEDGPGVEACDSTTPLVRSLF
jgi:hypothetical protein